MSKKKVEEKEEVFTTIRLTEDEWDSLRYKIDKVIEGYNMGDSANSFEISIMKNETQIKYSVFVTSTVYDREEGELDV